MQRKLAAILCADVYGYSRLMGEDEEATLRTLSSHRQLIDSSIDQHHGRFVNSAGDSVLVEFASVVDAMNCAVAIQAELRAANANLSPPRRMELRIGVNLGDVMAEGEQLYGDGVNVAARLESLADPGGICISEVVHGQIKNKLALKYEDRGEQHVKNIAEPVRVLRVLMDGVTPANQRTRHNARRYLLGGGLSLAAIIIGTVVLIQNLSLRPPRTSASIAPREKPALPLPSVPSIAVMPFTNLSGDPGQDYFSDGMTDDLVTDLSRLPGLFVIDRNSTFAYKGKATRAQQVGRELGVKYVLEGSARKAGDQVRINVELVDTGNGNQVWANRYDSEMRDVFKLQDQIVQSLITTVGLQLSALGKGAIIPQRTKNLEAYDYLLRGLEDSLLTTPTPEGFLKARKMFGKAAELDPGYSDAYAALGYLDLVASVWQWNSDPRAFDHAEELANKAIALDDSNAGAYIVRGSVAAFRGKRNRAIADSEQAVALDPNSAFAWTMRASVNSILHGTPEDTLAYVQKARRLDPRHPEIGCFEEGITYNDMGQPAQALDALKQCQPNNPYTHLNLVIAYSALGREREALAEARELMRVSPQFSLEQIPQQIKGGSKRQDPGAQRFLAIVRKAGMK